MKRNRKRDSREKEKKEKKRNAHQISECDHNKTKTTETKLPLSSYFFPLFVFQVTG
jgi:hypothetical protein